MKKSTFTPQYDILRQKLVQMRKKAALTQRQLAARIDREHSFVAKVEQGERRLDIVEFFWLCEALGQNPDKAVVDLYRQFRTQNGG